MHKSSSRFLNRLPASRFWSDFAPTFHLKEVRSEEVLFSKIMDTFKGRGSSSLSSLPDQWLSTIALYFNDLGMIPAMAERVVESFETRLENEGEHIHFSKTERDTLEAIVYRALQIWKK